MEVVLFESAAGYALFRVTEGEEIGSTLSSMQASIASFPTFSKAVSLAAFLPFKSAEDALDNANAISEGVLHPELKEFLAANVKSEQRLGVAEDKLASAIAESLPDAQCVKTKVVVELQRGIRYHFAKFISELKEGDLEKAQLGLGHSYSRSKVKFNVNRADNMVIQSICLLDQLEKDVNTFAMRVREWYSWHFPELVRIVPDNYDYARCARAIGDKSQASEESHLAILADILAGDMDRARHILEAAKTSMGYEISELDLLSIRQFADRVVHLSEYKKRLHDYLNKKMADIAPNLSALIGEIVGARLISHAGSLTNLAKYPASTVQILGAEKALFRALKTKGNTPKYGLIYHSSFISKAAQRNKGRISRYLANKASIASRIDSFSDFPTAKFGELLRSQVEERLSFYESGETPRKNLDVMREAMEAVKVQAAKKTPRKKRAAATQPMEDDAPAPAPAPAAAAETQSAKKKKAKQQQQQQQEEQAPAPEPTPMEEEAPKKKTPRKKKADTQEQTPAPATPATEKKKRAKKPADE
jgi:nucleolar protein 56